MSKRTIGNYPNAFVLREAIRYYTGTFKDKTYEQMVRNNFETEEDYNNFVLKIKAKNIQKSKGTVRQKASALQVLIEATALLNKGATHEL